MAYQKMKSTKMQQGEGHIKRPIIPVIIMHFCGSLLFKLPLGSFQNGLCMRVCLKNQFFS